MTRRKNSAVTQPRYALGPMIDGRGLGRRHSLVTRRRSLIRDKLVFIDETGASTKIARPARLRPRSKIALERCRAAVPHGALRTTTTFTAALRRTVDP